MERTVKFKLEGKTESFRIPEIIGKLNCIIVDSDNKISFSIYSSLGYHIYHNKEHIGTYYYAPRAILEGQRRIHFDTDSYDKFYLDESIDIIVDGPKDTEITFIVRYE